MTGQEINIAIAEACGWTGIAPYHNNGPLWGKSPAGTLNALPDYTTDLNAMHEAEKVLVDDCPYKEALVAVCKRDFRGNYFSSVDCIRATARQRAEAFLRTLGKWRE